MLSRRISSVLKPYMGRVYHEGLQLLALQSVFSRANYAIMPPLSYRG